MREKRIIDTLFFDLDDSNLEVAHRRMGIFVRHSINRLDYEPRVYFSGKKGFHFHFDFEPLELKVDLRKLAMKFVEFLNISNVPLDTHVTGDIQRIDRVPFTIHTKSRRLCIPIDPKWTLAKIKSESKKCNVEKRVEIIENGEVRKLIEEFNDPELYVVESVVPTLSQADFEVGYMRSHILEGMKEVHPLHYIRLAFVVEAFFNGWTENEIINGFKDVHEFDLEKTTNFVQGSIEKIRGGGLKPWRNDTLEKYAKINKKNVGRENEN